MRSAAQRCSSRDGLPLSFSLAAGEARRVAQKEGRQKGWGNSTAAAAPASRSALRTEHPQQPRSCVALRCVLFFVCVSRHDRGEQTTPHSIALLRRAAVVALSPPLRVFQTDASALVARLLLFVCVSFSDLPLVVALAAALAVALLLVVDRAAVAAALDRRAVVAARAAAAARHLAVALAPLPLAVALVLPPMIVMVVPEVVAATAVLPAVALPRDTCRKGQHTRRCHSH